MDEIESKLTLRQLHALPFILSNASVSDASKLSGVSEKQIWEWIKQDDFRSELYRQKNNIIAKVTNTLQSSSLRAAQVLIDIMENGKTDTIRHRAAVDLLSLNIKYTQTFELEERIKRLESQG